jgi:hypothetical protein
MSDEKGVCFHYIRQEMLGNDQRLRLGSMKLLVQMLSNLYPRPSEIWQTFAIRELTLGDNN